VLFRAGDGLPKVLPLSLLSRIEMVAPDRIQKSDGRFVMLHQGRLMPLLPTSPIDDIASKPHPVLVITANNHTIGLLVEEIIDIVEDELDVQLPSFTDNMVGSAQVKGNAVELIDVTYYLQAAYSSVYQQESKNILLVDDNLFFRDTLKPMLASAGYVVTMVSSAGQMQQILEHRKDFDAIMIDADMETPEGRNLAQHLRETLVNADFPIFRLYEMPSQAVLGLPVDDRMTRNLSKLDRQTLLGTLASILATQDANDTSTELAA
jgi:two-component system chemotaxis sensor kinase CheA